MQPGTRKARLQKHHGIKKSAGGGCLRRLFLKRSVFVKAMRSIDTFRGETDIRVWLCQIAKNCYFSHLKKQQKIIDIDEVEFTDSKSTIEEQVLNQSDAIQIHRLLHDLAEPYKEVFMLRVFGELSFKQIADIFQKTDNWACVTYHRARNKILSQMEVENE